MVVAGVFVVVAVAAYVLTVWSTIDDGNNNYTNSNNKYSKYNKANYAIVVAIAVVIVITHKAQVHVYVISLTFIRVCIHPDRVMYTNTYICTLSSSNRLFRKGNMCPYKTITHCVFSCYVSQ